MEQQSRAYLHGLGAVLAWSTVASAFKLTLRELTPVAMLFYASLTSLLILLAILTWQGRLGVLKQIRGREWLAYAGLGFLNPFLYYTILFRAYQLLPGQEAQALNYTWAITLALLSIPILKQRIRPASLVALVISFAGVWIISTRGDVFSTRFAEPVGVLLAVGSSVVWALFWIGNVRDPRDEIVKLTLCFVFGTVFVGLYAVATGDPLAARWPGIAGALYAGLFEMGLTFVLWLTALRLSRTTAQVGNLIFLSPFISLVLLHFVVGEEIFRSSIVGLVLILAGIALQRRTDRIPRQTAPESPPAGGSSEP